MANSVEHLQAMRAQLASILEYLPRLGVDTERLPIIDVLETESQTDSHDESEDEDGGANATSTGSASGKSTPNSNSIGSGDRESGFVARERNALLQPRTGIPGLRVFREALRNDIEQIDKFLARHARHRTTVAPSAFSTNAPYLVAVWNELVRARPPIIFVDKSFPIPILEKNKDGLRPASPTVTFSRKGAVAAKVDVVADNGRQWIRVNTIKNSRLLAEFRELDSYLTESSSDDDDEQEGNLDDKAGCHRSSSPRKAKPLPDELDSSLLKMGKALVSAAQAYASTFEPGESANTKSPPKILLRLTRLLIDSESLGDLEGFGLRVVGPRQRSITSDPKEIDPRIAQTLRELLRMGIEVILGDQEFHTPPDLRSPLRKPTVRLIPSRQINLDLSVLIALISDITHAPLPASPEEVRRRYIPIPAERERSRRRKQQQREQKELAARARAEAAEKTKPGSLKTKIKARVVDKENTEDSESDGEEESVHSHALANQVLREIELSLLDEITERISHPSPASGSFPGHEKKNEVEFWTSKEARDRCVSIVSKIGGPAERKRAAALFFDHSLSERLLFGTKFRTEDGAREAYWQGSRHQRDTVPELVPLRIFEEDDQLNPGHLLTTANNIVNDATQLNNSFYVNLERTCQRLLSSGAISHPRSHPSSSTPEDERNASKPGEIERASVTRLNTRLTAHTVLTLYRGARKRWTTLTANRASVREIIKECGKFKESSGSEELTRRVSGLHIDKNAEEEKEEDGVNDRVKKDGEEEVAAIWVVEPRSLAESMRSDYVPL